MVLLGLKRLFIRLLIFLASCILLLITVFTKTDITAFFQDNKQDVNTSWSYFPCDWKLEEIPRPTRRRVALQCPKFSAFVSYEEVPFNATPAVTTLPPHDPCLARLVQSSWCNDATDHVPRLLHYVWFSPSQMALHTFVGVLSAVRHVKPCLVLLHGDALPEGPYWHALLQLVPNIVHVTCDRPRQIFGRAINVMEHSADVTRLQVLIEYGGIYLDKDMLVLRSLDSIRTYPAVIGSEVENVTFCNAMIASQKGAEFLKLWLAEYVTFRDTDWDQHSSRVPLRLHAKRPDLAHVVDLFFRPNWYDIGRFYQRGLRHAWGDLLALHLYARFHRGFFAAGESIVKENCTIAEMFRYVLHGASDACLAPKSDE